MKYAHIIQATEKKSTDDRHNQVDFHNISAVNFQ